MLSRVMLDALAPVGVLHLRDAVPVAALRLSASEHGGGQRSSICERSREVASCDHVNSRRMIGVFLA